jgi:PIN domain
MAIYLDANALWSWRTFTEGDRLAVSIVARQLGQRVLIPWIAAREAEEEYQRSLQDALDELDRAFNILERRFDSSFELTLEPQPRVDFYVATWRRRLEEFADILPKSEGDALQALEREISGTPPAAPRTPRKPGRGGRDAAIWLSIARHHASSDEEGHLLSSDKVFSNGHGELNQELRSDLGDNPRAMRVYSDLESFLSRLGTTARGRHVTLPELQSLATPALADALISSVDMTLAVWGTEPPTRWRYTTRLEDAEPVELLEQRRYEQGDDAVLVVNARWDLTVECRYHERSSDGWNGVGGIRAHGEVQLFLEERGGNLRPATIVGIRIGSANAFLMPAFEDEAHDVYVISQ